MLKIFSIFSRISTGAAPKPEKADMTWVCDMLRHPDIARMDARELGDLPFPGRAVHKASDARRPMRRKAAQHCC